MIGSKHYRRFWGFRSESAAGVAKAKKSVWEARFRALSASIAVHIIVLTVFGLIRFSRSRVQEQPSLIPTAKISSVKKLIESAPVTVKPKIKRISKSRFVKNPKSILPVEKFFEASRPGKQDSEYPAGSSVLQSRIFPASRTIAGQGIEFFGSWTDERKICYLVDCSGSMQGLFGRVRKKLVGSIESLEPDKYFSIIFFGSGRLFEFEKGRLVRATPRSKSEAFKFISSIRAAGQTNALEALQRALQVRHRSADRPSIIYFLTDGFELTADDSKTTSQKISNLLKRLSPDTKINTIGFWPEKNDLDTLKIIAGQSGGQCVIIADSFILENVDK